MHAHTYFLIVLGAFSLLARPGYGQEPSTSIVVQMGTMSGHTEGVLRQARFDDRVAGSCYVLCAGGPVYPRTVGGESATLVTVRRQWSNGTGLALTYQNSATPGRSVGYRRPGYSTSIEPHLQMISLSLYGQGESGWRLGAGPALYSVRTVQTLGVDGGRHEARERQLGALAELGVVWPRRSRFFVDVALQGRFVPGLHLDGQEIRYFEGGYGWAEQREPWPFPESRFSLHHAALTAGFGVRF